MKASVIFYFSVFAILFIGMMKDDESKTENTVNENRKWELVSETTTATVYNAEAKQCNADFLHTASMFKINPKTIEKDRILAMERTMMAEFGISYGDTVRVEGTGRYDGEWQVQDTMNKRFKGQHKIDFLVPSNVRHGKWTDVKVYKRLY